MAIQRFENTWIHCAVFVCSERICTKETKGEKNPHNGFWYLVEETMHNVIVNKGLSSARYLNTAELLLCVW